MRKAAKVRSPVSVHFARRFPQQSELATLSALQRQFAAGGPGALLWMEVAALFGMATKYSEGFLAIKYRTIDKNGHYLGGPFYYIENGMGSRWKWLAKLFALFGMLAGLLGIGTITQINGITSAANNFFDPDKSGIAFTLFEQDYTWTTVIMGLLITACAALVIIGGLKRISQISQIVVPFMAVAYVLCCLILMACNVKAIPAAVVEIVRSAFGMDAVAGGALGAMMVAMQKGDCPRHLFQRSRTGFCADCSSCCQNKGTGTPGSGNHDWYFY